MSEELEFKPVSEQITDLIEKTLTKISEGSFSERHPEFGRMIKCQVCLRRHRDSIKCEQKFAVKHYLEDVETGEVETVYATTPQTRKGVMGAAQFKGKRLKSHVNKLGLQLIERTREVFEKLGFSLDVSAEVFQANVKKARAMAARQLRKERRITRNFGNHQRSIARRINLGLIIPGSR